MSTKPEVGELLSDHDVFWLNDDELLYRVPSTGIDWTALGAIDCQLTKTAGSLREYLNDRAMLSSSEANSLFPPPVHHRFEVYAQVNPGAAAVKFNRTELTYGELDTQADGLAVCLQQHGLGPGDYCALCMEPSLAMVRAMLAVLKAGAAYVLLDPRLPGERILAVLALSRPRTVITQKNFSTKLGATNAKIILCGEDAADLPYSWPQESPTQGSSPAYAIFAFSETGSLSIGVRTHLALISRLESMQKISPIGQGDSVLQNTDPMLDVSELLWPLSHGARVVIPPTRDEMDPAHVRQLINQEHITVMHVVPSLLQPLPIGSRTSELGSLRALLWANERPTGIGQGGCYD